MSLNVIVLQGRLTVEPELKTTPNGVSVTSFKIAVDRKYQQKGEERKVDFIPIVAWRSQAEVITRFFRKGSMIGIEGELQTRNYTDKDGNKRTAFEVVANHITFCESKNKGNDNGNIDVDVDPATDPLPAFAEKTNNDFEEILSDDSDLPF